MTIPNIDIPNMHMVYHWILQVHSVSCITETCSCLVTVSTSLNCCKVRLVTKHFNLACSIMCRTIKETTKEIRAVTNRKHVYNVITKQKFFLAKSKSLLCLFANQKFPFYADTVEQNPLKFLVISVNQDQNQRILKILVKYAYV